MLNRTKPYFKKLDFLCNKRRYNPKMLHILGIFDVIFVLSVLSFHVVSLVGSKTILEHEPYSELLPEKMIAYFPLTYNATISG